MNAALPPVYVEGLAFWSAKLPGWPIASAVIRGEQAVPAEIAMRPLPALLAPTERRRAPDAVAIALEVAARACESAGRSAADLPAVFASTYGDIAISDYICATLAGTPTLLSPTKFHNSVHNAAAGYWSIGTASYAPYTTISAFKYTFGVGLLEAAAQLACERKPVLYVAFDVEAKGPLATVVASRGLLGVALVLSLHGAEQGQRRLTLRVDSCAAADPSRAHSAAAPLLAANALAPCLPLFEALAHPQPASIVVALSERTALRIEVGCR